MDVPQISPELREALRTWFHSKDRSIYLADDTFAYLPGGIGYFSVALISEITLTANATSVTFSNIPQGFKHLLIISRLAQSAANEVDNTIIRLNGDTGANYDIEYLQANGATASAFASRGTATSLLGFAEGTLSRPNSYGSNFIFIPGYSVVGDKVVLGIAAGFGNVSADADQFLRVQAVHWRNLNVLTSVSFVPQSGPNFVSGTKIQLYGML